MTDVKHEQLKGIISMRPGHTAGATCTCGWHSHTKTFREHLNDVTLNRLYQPKNEISDRWEPR